MAAVLMQCDGDTIRAENGKVSDLKLTPESRRKDVVIGDEFK